MKKKKKYLAWKSRIEGVGSNGSMSSKSKDVGFDGSSCYGSTSSNSYGGNISKYQSRGDAHEENKKKEEKKRK